MQIAAGGNPFLVKIAGPQNAKMSVMKKIIYLIGLAAVLSSVGCIHKTYVNPAPVTVVNPAPANTTPVVVEPSH
jgi:hypothetical protein